MWRFSTCCLLAVLTGCATPNVQEQPSEKPAVPAPQAANLPTAWKHATASETAATTPWWEALNDSVLDDLIVQSLTSNPDIHIADARLSEIRGIAADADPDEQAVASAALNAAEQDARASRLAVAHAVTTAYADARLAEKRKGLLQQRMRLTHDLTTRLNRKLQAGLTNSRTLRDAEQTEIETHQATTRIHHDFQQAVNQLALLTGVAPIEFKLPANGDFFAGHTALRPDLPDSVIERRPDVQAAWQRLLAATSADSNDDNLPITAQIEQAETSPAGRDALYRKAVLAALNDVETALAGWRSANAEAKASQDFLEIQTANVQDMERELAAGRASRIDLLKAMLAENQAQESALLALHAQRIAFAAAQLALARD